MRTFLVVFLVAFVQMAPSFADVISCNRILHPVQVKRFSVPMEALTPFLPKENATPAELDALIEKIAKEDARGHIFQIEALLRIYKDVYKNEHGKNLEKLLVRVKRLEDLIGKYGEGNDFLEFAKNMEFVPAHKDVLIYLEEQRDAAQVRLRNALPELPQLLLDLHVQFSKISWEMPAEDAKSVAKFIKKEFEKRAKFDYDMGDLEEGIHKLRRNVRWFLIYFQSLRGMVVLEAGGGSLNEYNYLETHPIAQSRFSKLASDLRISVPVEFPAPYFLALSKIVKDLEIIKAAGQNIEVLAKALLRTGQVKTEKDARKQAELLAWKNYRHIILDYEAAATRVLEELERTGLLKKSGKRMVFEP